MRRITVLLSVLLLMLGMTGTAAVADNDLWDSGDVLDTDSHEVDVQDVLNVEVSISGDTELDVDEAGEFTVEIDNHNDSTADLEDWKLGLGVDGFDDNSNFTLEFCQDSGHENCVTLVEEGDAVTGTGVQVDDSDDNVIWILGDDEDPLSPDDGVTQEYLATFHEGGNFTGTAYVIDTSDD